MSSSENASLSGNMLIGQTSVVGQEISLSAINPVTNKKLSPSYGGASQAQIDQAVGLAWHAFDAYRGASIDDRAVFLETIADEILALGNVLVERAVAESGLPRGRIEGERGRTVGQLRMFAKTIRFGQCFDARIDSALPERSPLPRADLRLQKVPLGPVAVFGASNFPLAFSVAGGDTASALAAGCPVIVKAHPAHPGTSELIGTAIQKAVKKCHLPEGVFSLLYGADNAMGAALVSHPLIKAVGFTGSRQGGLALLKLATQRSEPIPVYAEMSSINPVFIMPNKLANDANSVASGLVASLAMGAGQFCTNPGLVFVCEGAGLEAFLQKASIDISMLNSQTMLTPDICAAYYDGVKSLADNPHVTQLASGQRSEQVNQCQAHLFVTDAASFLADSSMGKEVFGSSSLIIKCKSLTEAMTVTEALEGQLTATIQMLDSDIEAVRPLLPILERKVGRILCNGYPTGVEVCDSMVHGGPFPATSDSRTTSVGSAAIDRFLRPVCYQDFPPALLPESIQDANPLLIPQLVDGLLNS